MNTPTPTEEDRAVKCDNCGWTGRESEMERTLFEVHGLAERLAPGETTPAGECPDLDCGALVHLVEPPSYTAAARLPRVLAVCKRLHDDCDSLNHEEIREILAPVLADTLPRVEPSYAPDMPALAQAIPISGKRYLVRCSCEYSLLVNADSEEEAIDKANEQPPEEWDQAWSSDEVEEGEPETGN